MEAIDHNLFNAWKSGDKNAIEKVWEHFWTKLFSVAVKFCMNLLNNRLDAEECALRAFHKTIEEIGLKLMKQKVQWMGEPQFYSYVKKTLFCRCRDEIRRELAKKSKSMDFLFQGETPLDYPNDPERTVIHSEEVYSFLTTLFVIAEDLKDKKVLQETLLVIISYLEEQLKQNNPNDIDLDRAELYEFIKEKLQINDNTVYVRMSKIKNYFLRQIESRNQTSN